MAITYTQEIIGTLTLCQAKKETVDGKRVTVKDEKGRTVYNKFCIEMRESNWIGCFIYVYKEEHPKDPERPWVHQLIVAIADEKHLKKILKDKPKGEFQKLFGGKLTNIKLNLYYNDCQVLMKYMTLDGLKVQGYYREPKTEK